MNKLYQQLMENMSYSDISASFGDTYIWDTEREEVAHVMQVGDEDEILVDLLNSGHKYFSRDTFFSGRFELFPPYEGMAVANNSTYCVTRLPMRNYKKGMSARHYDHQHVGDLVPRGGVRGIFPLLAKSLFRPSHLLISEAWTRINTTEMLSAPIGAWWAVAFCNVADGLAIYYKTTPVAKLLDSTTVEKLTNDPALLGMVRAEFPTITWR